MRLFTIALTFVGTAFALTHAPAQTIKNRAEDSNYQQTSTHGDVLKFLDAVEAASGGIIRLETIGKSAGAKPMVMAVVAKPEARDAKEARKQGKLVVYLQANIHGGEVEGKEAVLRLMREISAGEHRDLLSKLVLLVVPNYNIDGNDKMGSVLRNRGSQDGPDPVGERANGQGLDLNRDGIKAESLEMRAALEKIYRAWDPDAMMDLHTTNGTRHGFDLTYSPPLNPNTDPAILAFTRDQLLPSVRKTLAGQGYKLFDYGNIEGRDASRAWRTFGEEGRYITNYAGLRGKVAVLSEAASFLPFQRRIEVTHQFTVEVLRYLAANSKTCQSALKQAATRFASKTAPKELGVRFEMAQRGEETIQLEDTAKATPRNKAPVGFVEGKFPIFDRFSVTKTSAVPAGYLIPANETKVLDLLVLHGIQLEQLNQETPVKAAAFAVKSAERSGSQFGGGRTLKLEGDQLLIDHNAVAGSFVVRLAQPLGTLAFMLLEPESLDGVSAWGFLAEEPTTDKRFPILKLMALPPNKLLTKVN